MKEALIVGAGAVFGAFARWGLSVGLGSLTAAAVWPHAEIWPLLLINFVGSALLGYLQPGVFWGKGVLGGFTSFSTFATATVAINAWSDLGHFALIVTG